MNTIFLDFDNTIVESNKRVIEIINKRYNVKKTEDNLEDYGYCSIYPITRDEVIEIYENDEFFYNLELKKGALNFILKYIGKYKIIISTKGTPLNISKKTEWIKNNLPAELIIKGINNDNFSKSMIDMKNSIQIDDNLEALDTNASLKILYRDFNMHPWQLLNNQENIFTTNTWEEIDSMIEFYSKYDFKDLKEKKEI